MQQKAIIATTVALYVFLAFLAAVVTDFHDRYNSQALGVRASLALDFSETRTSHSDAVDILQRVSTDADLGLYKLSPDLDEEGAQQFVDLGTRVADKQVGWFGSYTPAQIVGTERLDNSPPDGTYLVTADGDVDRAIRSLNELGITVNRTDASALTTVQNLMQQPGFAAPVIAASALIASLTIFWLTLRARSRALRVLAGVPPLRIQAQDLGRLATILVLAAIGVAVFSVAIVGLFRGWVYVPIFISITAILTAMTLAVALAVAIALSSASWPSVELLARRRPAVRSLRWAAGVVQAATLITLLAFAGPGWVAVVEAQRSAAQLTAWNELSDQVALAFGMRDEDLDTVAPQVSDMVARAEDEEDAAVSYGITEGQWGGDFEGYSTIALVNTQWITLMDRAIGTRGLVPVDLATVEPMLAREIAPSLDVWNETGSSAAVLPTLTAFTTAPSSSFPVITGGASGQLDFAENVLILEMSRAAELFDGPNVVSLASSGNIVFTSASATQERIAQANLTAEGLRQLGIEGTIRPVYVAEQGILQAQFAAYLGQLLSISLAALALSFGIASATSATITSLLRARRDFPLRLAGEPWAVIARVRILVEGAICIGVAAAVIATQPATAAVATLVATGLALAVISASHMIAVPLVFRRVINRQI